VYRSATVKCRGVSWQGFETLIHAYEDVDLQRVWHIVQHDLPKVKDAIEKILPRWKSLKGSWATQKGQRQIQKMKCG